MNEVQGTCSGGRPAGLQVGNITAERAWCRWRVPCELRTSRHGMALSFYGRRAVIHGPVLQQQRRVVMRGRWWPGAPGDRCARLTAVMDKGLSEELTNRDKHRHSGAIPPPPPPRPVCGRACRVGHTLRHTQPHGPTGTPPVPSLHCERHSACRVLRAGETCVHSRAPCM